MYFDSLKCVKMGLRPWLKSGPSWGSLQPSPRLPTDQTQSREVKSLLAFGLIMSLQISQYISKQDWLKNWIITNPFVTNDQFVFWWWRQQHIILAVHRPIDRFWRFYFGLGLYWFHVSGLYFWATTFIDALYSYAVGVFGIVVVCLSSSVRHGCIVAKPYAVGSRQWYHRIGSWRLSMGCQE